MTVIVCTAYVLWYSLRMCHSACCVYVMVHIGYMLWMLMCYGAMCVCVMVRTANVLSCVLRMCYLGAAYMLWCPMRMCYGACCVCVMVRVTRETMSSIPVQSREMSRSPGHFSKHSLGSISRLI